MNVIYQQVESEVIDVSSTAIGLTTSKFSSANFALCYVETAAIMVDAVNTPTASSGMPIRAGVWFRLWQPDFVGFKAIKKTSTDAVLYVAYYKFKDIFPFGAK